MLIRRDDEHRPVDMDLFHGSRWCDLAPQDSWSIQNCGCIVVILLDIPRCLPEERIL